MKTNRTRILPARGDESIMNRNRSVSAPMVAACAAAVLGWSAPAAYAIDISSGEITGSFDTTITYGASWRASDLDEDNVAKAVFNPTVGFLPNSGQRAALGRWSNNGDDGNLNYPDSGDLISNTIKLTSELDLQYRNFGAFVRFSAFYDFENEDRDVLSDIAEEKVGKDIRLLDAYIWGDHLFGDSAVTWRLGSQVVSWGESTFIQGGINVINPVDVSKLRVAGAELKEAFEGVNMIWASFEVTPNFSVEPLYIFEYQQVDPDPAGTYFSTNDLATPGGAYAMLGFGTVPQPVINPDLYHDVCLFGNYGGSDTGLPPDLVAAGCALSFPRVETRFPSESGQYGLAMRYFAENLNYTEFGFYFLNYHSRLPLISGRSITSTALSSGQYWTEYPEDIHLWGASFNTTIGTWSLSGEVSYRPNAPLQIDDVEVLFAGLTPLNVLIPAPVNRFKSQLGEFGPGELIQGWDEHNMWQAQTTTTRLFGPGNFLKANQIAFVAEVGFNYISDLPDKDYLRYNGDGTDTGGGPDYLSGDFRNPQTETDGFADDFSWGYRLLVRADYNNVFGTAWTMTPSIGWAHDVSGTTPGPGGSFIDGRKQLTLGLGFSYLQQWGFDLSYTSYFGAGRYNLLKDRDFIGASIRYSF
ncbi:DUF1302 domain-containing protein [Elongatibacter sediminis]|uniref:DUF1302 domain-containing protein n=1 Tax=Elongatibacter sediminis TaxID=3119006 RepID=A0AAW9RL71_9GAMM